MIIVVNRHKVKANRRNDTCEPPIRVSDSRSGKGRYVHSIEIPPGSIIVYEPTNPLPCGATVWIETPDETRKRIGGTRLNPLPSTEETDV